MVGLVLNVYKPEVYWKRRAYIVASYKLLKAIAMWYIGNLLCKRSGAENSADHFSLQSALASQFVGGKVVFLLIHAAGGNV